MYLKNLMGDVLIGGRFRSVAGVLKFAISSGVCLEDVDLRNSNLAGVDLDGVSMRRASLWGANLSGANFSGCDFSGADLRLANLKDSCVSSSNFSHCDFRGAYFSKTIINEANFSHCKFSCPSFFSVDLSVASSFDSACYIHEGEVECKLSRVPLVVQGLQWPVVILNDSVLIGGRLYKGNSDDTILYISDYCRDIMCS